MNIGIICGSQQRDAQSTRVGQYVLQALQQSPWCKQAWLHALGEDPLPIWQPDVWQESHPWHQQLNTLATQLGECDGFVVITPEWHGMVPGALKNFFLLWHKKELAHKPALLVAVSAGLGGSYPIAEMRMSSYKNQYLCYLPEHVIVRTVNDVLHDTPKDKQSEDDQEIRERISYSLDLLGEYAKALGSVRDSKAWDPQRYPNGM